MGNSAPKEDYIDI